MRTSLLLRRECGLVASEFEPNLLISLFIPLYEDLCVATCTHTYLSGTPLTWLILTSGICPNPSAVKEYETSKLITSVQEGIDIERPFLCQCCTMQECI